jgi:hypothetical protein
MWSVVHSIEVTLPLGKRSVVVGASTGNTARRDVRSVLISPEGLVIFDAKVEGGRLTVRRALPPLDHEDLAPQLFEDVRLALFPPRASQSVEVGWLESGRPVCRFAGEAATTDVVLEANGGYRVVRYDAGGDVERVLTGLPPVRSGFASRMQLVAPGVTGYRMDFELLRIERPPEGAKGAPGAGAAGSRPSLRAP